MTVYTTRLSTVKVSRSLCIRSGADIGSVLPGFYLAVTWQKYPACADDFNHTIGEIVISDLAHANVGGLPYASSVDMTHSSDLRTMQEIFHVRATTGSNPWLGDAANVNDLSDLVCTRCDPDAPIVLCHGGYNRGHSVHMRCGLALSRTGIMQGTSGRRSAVAVR